MKDLIPEELVHRLLHTYRSPDDVDLYIGGVMESPVPGTQLGPTMHCLIRQQFEALRNGDRFFYTNPGQFTDGQLREIKKTTLTSVLCANADDPNTLKLPENMFMKSSGALTNKPQFCSNFPKLDINAWD
jgi:peroxidase